MTKSLSVAAQDQVEARSGIDDVVAGAALDVVVTAEVADDVVAVATVDDVVAGAALHRIVAAVAEQCVVADAGDEGVGVVCAAEDHVLVARVLQVVIGPRRRRVVANDQRGQDAAADRIVSALVGQRIGIIQVRIELLRLIDLEDQAGCREHVGRQMRRVGVGHDHVGERIVLDLAEEVQAFERGR